ncbi:unnamed protein product [Microthlaspi erraticum]|uniref:Uncharacterized protein n=1 Tax=Microthlaspi erraticum TaxID=1685480 RepID=A0A6D2JJT6_9BRAS|nr:unnamed protein product [Microthlaspi erraticum]
MTQVWSLSQPTCGSFPVNLWLALVRVVGAFPSYPNLDLVGYDSPWVKPCGHCVVVARWDSWSMSLVAIATYILAEDSYSLLVYFEYSKPHVGLLPFLVFN